MFPGILQCDKAMVIMRLPRGAQRLLADCVVARTTRTVIFRRTTPTPDRTSSIKIKTKLDAAGTKALRPIQRLAGFEIVPLDADPHLLEAAIELLPAVAHICPRGLR